MPRGPTDPVETHRSSRETPAPRWVPRAWLPRIAAACLLWPESHSDGLLSPCLLESARGGLAAPCRSPIWPDSAAIAGWFLSPSHKPLLFGHRVLGRSPAAVVGRPRGASRRRDRGAKTCNSPLAVVAPALLSVVVSLTRSSVSAYLRVSHTRFRDPSPPFPTHRLPRERFPCFLAVL